MKKNLAIGSVILLILSSIALNTNINSLRQDSNKTTSNPQTPLVFSSKEMMGGIWNSYKKEYLEPNTYRTLDKQQNNITTSEGQSYTMLRSVWMDDKKTFDYSWTWTKYNMQRKSDSLFSWLFGQKSDGKYGIIEEKGGINTASDADVDIATSLIFASNRWGQKEYYDEAKKIITDIWNLQVAEVDGKYILLSNDIEKKSESSFVINPSYFAPYAFKIFAQIDQKNNWNKLAQDSYTWLDIFTSSNLDKPTLGVLTPDWVIIDKKTGNFVNKYKNNLTSNFGFEALRTPWRIALDYQWFNDPKAKKYLNRLVFLNDRWKQDKVLKAVYSHEGKVVENYENNAFYGGVLGHFIVNHPETATEIYNTKLKSLYNPDTYSFTQKLSYYDDNWVWFGMSLYNNNLINLSENIAYQN